MRASAAHTTHCVVAASRRKRKKFRQRWDRGGANRVSHRRMAFCTKTPLTLAQACGMLFSIGSFPDEFSLLHFLPPDCAFRILRSDDEQGGAQEQWRV